MSGAVQTTTRPRGYRLVETRRGDTPQSVAARELDDASRWPEIVAINNLAPPYMVDSLAELEGAPEGRVTLAGRAIKVPAPPKRASAVADNDIYGIDVLLAEDGQLGVDEETGDWATVGGPENLAQALRNRFVTKLKELIWHPTYGNGVFGMLGRGGTAPRRQLAAAHTNRAARRDPRVADVRDVEAEVAGDRLLVGAVVVATDGKPLPVAVGDEGE